MLSDVCCACAAVTTDGLDTPSRSPQLFTMWFSKPAAIAFGIIQLAVTLVAFLLSVPAGWVGYDTEAANDTWKEGNSRRLARDNMDVDTPERFEDRLLISKWRLQTWPLLDWYKHTKFFTKNASFVPLITDGKIKVGRAPLAKKCPRASRGEPMGLRMSSSLER